MAKHDQDEPKEGTKGAVSDDDKKVGYGNPPDHTKFKKDNTFGKGRRKGSKGMKRMVAGAFDKKVTVKENGKPRRRSRSEVGLDQLANRFAQGDPKATDKSLQLLERYGPQDDLEEPSPERIEANVAALMTYAAMKRQFDGFEEKGDDD